MPYFIRSVLSNFALAHLLASGISAASLPQKEYNGVALLDTINNVCLSDYAADYQLFSALGNEPVTFSLIAQQLTLLGKANPSVCDVNQGDQFECNMGNDSGSDFSVSTAQLLQYRRSANGSYSTEFFGCTNRNPPVGAPSTNYFTTLPSTSPSCSRTTLKIIPAKQCPSIVNSAIKDLTTGICLSDYSQTHAIYAARGSPVDKFTLKGTRLTLSVDGWTPTCVSSESGGYSKQFQCSNDVDWSDGAEMPSSYAFSTIVDHGHTVLAYQQKDGSFSTSFYGCGPDSAVYFAVNSDPSSSPGVCHSAQLAFVDDSQCYKVAAVAAVAVSDVALDTVAEATTQKADELGLNDV